MGQRGPKALPTNVHLLKGNPSKLSKSQLTDAVRPDVEIPKPGKHLMPDALKEWKRITVELEKLGLISKIDKAALEVYCQAYARWVRAELKMKEFGEAGEISETPNGFQQMSAWLTISNRAVDQMKAFLTEFGMSPSSRGRVTTSSPQMSLFGDEQNKAQKYFT